MYNIGKLRIMLKLHVLYIVYQITRQGKAVNNTLGAVGAHSCIYLNIASSVFACYIYISNQYKRIYKGMYNITII